MNLNTWIAKYNAGEFNSTDVDCQVEAGWFDWFCSDRALAGRLAKLAPKVKKLSFSPKINPETTEVIFKNNCPLNGNLYDDIRFCDSEGDVIYTVIPRTGYNAYPARSEVWGQANDFAEPLAVGEWRDVLRFFGV